MRKEIKAIVDFLEEARNKYNIPKENLEKNGAITYANGNDGTDFDWVMNDRLCEFGYGVKDGSVWAFKLNLYKSGEAEIYCYPNGEMSSVETLKKQLMGMAEVKQLKSLMMRNADNKGMFDRTLDELGLM